jgi:hypothetical protein
VLFGALSFNVPIRPVEVAGRLPGSSLGIQITMGPFLGIKYAERYAGLIQQTWSRTMAREAHLAIFRLHIRPHVAAANAHVTAVFNFAPLQDNLLATACVPFALFYLSRM